MELKQNHLAHVRYTKTTHFGGTSKGEVTERVILPTYIPSDSVKALDVSAYTEADALLLQSLAKEYAEYVELQMNRVFNFEDWIDHSYGAKISSPTYAAIKRNGLQYRTFKLAALEVIESE